MQNDTNHEPDEDLKLEQLPLPLEIFTPNDVVRPEYNIGKFAGIIFMSPYALAATAVDNRASAAPPRPVRHDRRCEAS